MKKNIFLLILICVIFSLVGCEEERVKISMPEEASMPNETLYLDVNSFDFTNCYFSGFGISTFNKEYNEEFMSLFKEYLNEIDFVLLDWWRGPSIQKDSAFELSIMSNQVLEYESTQNKNSIRFYFTIQDDRLYISIPTAGEKNYWILAGHDYVSTFKISSKEFRSHLKSILDSVGGGV